MKLAIAVGFGLALCGASAGAQDMKFPPEQIAKGAGLFERNCTTCHGTRMRNPQWGIDLKTFPRDAHSRFLNSVTYGRGNMPSWEDVLSPDDIEALWSYVVAGEPDE